MEFNELCSSLSYEGELQSYTNQTKMSLELLPCRFPKDCFLTLEATEAVLQHSLLTLMSYSLQY